MMRHQPDVNDYVTWNKIDRSAVTVGVTLTVTFPELQWEGKRTIESGSLCANEAHKAFQQAKNEMSHDFLEENSITLEEMCNKIMADRDKESESTPKRKKCSGC